MNRHLHLAAPSFLLGLCLAWPAGLSAQQPSAAASPARHSSVTFQDGLLSVQASNASLNGLLREIAKSTGMKISGSVPEDRVFGTYGPADPQRIISTLLDGTGVNVLIVSNTAETPLELQLSPRSGAASPPNPAEQAQQNDEADQTPGNTEEPSTSEVEQDHRAHSKPEPSPPPSPDPSASTAPSETTQPLVFPKISPNTAPATGTTTPANPDDDQDTTTEGVKTPQQIFEQLQKLQNNNNQGTPDSNEQAPQQ